MRLPRFTLRRALIAIAAFALFLGWLRPHRAYFFAVQNETGIAVAPLYPNRTFVFYWTTTETTIP